MCGIAGVLDLDRATPPAELARLASSMAESLRHRGPDAIASWAAPDGPVAFGHTRLAILDLSDAGAQPMHDRTDRWTVAFNGEIYNAPDLRQQLDSEGHQFRGHADTEVLVEGLAAWGIDGALARIEGMYAFAAWEHEHETLHLARDPLGEKPLYHARVGRQVLFGSELKALAQHPGFRPSVDPQGVAELLRRSFIPAPGTIYDGVSKLPPGTVLSIPARDRDPTLEPRRHFDYVDLVTRAVTDRWHPSEDELVDTLDGALQASVRARRDADVPLGAFLSGGIDSSLVVAILQSQLDRPVRTFTVDVGAAAGSEARKAAAVANHLGTEHTTIRLTEQDALDVVPALHRIYDEPFADPSGIPTYLVARETRSHVTVAMSGDGGDELFGGYNRYVQGAAAWDRMAGVPVGLRRGAGAVLGALPAGAVDRATAASARLIGRSGPTRPGSKLQRLAQLAPAQDADDLYGRAAWYWLDADRLAGATPRAVLRELPSLGTAEHLMLLDGMAVLPDQMLTKVDRASMATSLEVRVPLLAPGLAELAWRLPPDRKLAGGRGKLPLRGVLRRYLPDRLIDQPKQGFDPPLSDWLRGPLRPWAEDLLSPHALRTAGLVAPEPVVRAWGEHLKGRRVNDYRLWAVLMLHEWARHASAGS